jgi:hypothetical protein
MPGSISAGQGESPLTDLEQVLACKWKNIRDAKQRTLVALRRLSEVVDAIPGPNSDTSIIVHGSLAREECTSGSDLDWTLLVDGQADANHHDTLLNIRGALGTKDNQGKHVVFAELGLKEPGQEGTFGSLAFSQPMIHYIGGEEDSNSNTTRRVLLLLEAFPIGKRQEAFERVRKGILKRYLDEDRGLLRSDLDGKYIRWVPLFLLNDFARYWRTMAVDFAYKQFDRGSKGYALRSIKLGVSRKLLFASGLLACFWCDPAVSMNANQENSKQSLIDCLDLFLSRTPLERIAWFFLVQYDTSGVESFLATAKNLFASYDDFLGLLNDPERRVRLDKLRPDQEATDPVFNDARKIRQRFRLAVQDMFLAKNSPLYELTIEKGIF